MPNKKICYVTHFNKKMRRCPYRLSTDVPLSLRARRTLFLHYGRHDGHKHQRPPDWGGRWWNIVSKKCLNTIQRTYGLVVAYAFNGFGKHIGYRYDANFFALFFVGYAVGEKNIF